MTRLRRRFTLSDAMIVVGALALAFAAARLCVQLGLIDTTPFIRIMLPAVFVALALTIVLVPLRLRRPRPRRMDRGPGTVACCAVALGVVFFVAELANDSSQRLISARSRYLNHVAVNFVFRLLQLDVYGLVVSASWLVLAISGRWRAEPDWIDRAGRVLGVAWILSSFVVSWL